MRATWPFELNHCLCNVLDAPPSFTDQGYLKRRYRAWPASHTIRLKCEATGAPPLQFRWLKDGQKLLSRRMEPYLNSSLWFLRLRDVVPDDSGKYTCIVTNPYGSINHTFTLNVVGKSQLALLFVVVCRLKQAKLFCRSTSRKFYITAPLAFDDWMVSN